MRLSAKPSLPINSLLTCLCREQRLAKGFAESKALFAESIGPSAKDLDPVVHVYQAFACYKS
jgi:hypothetical protein